MQTFLKVLPAGFCRWNHLSWASPYKYMKTEYLVSCSFTGYTLITKIKFASWRKRTLIRWSSLNRSDHSQIISSGGTLRLLQCTKEIFIFYFFAQHKNKCFQMLIVVISTLFCLMGFSDCGGGNDKLPANPKHVRDLLLHWRR